MSNTIGVLVVHGIGGQKPGETLGKLLNGLRRVAPPHRLPAQPTDGSVGELAGQQLRFYEVYWADLLKGDIIRRSFIMDELNSLPWFPMLNSWRAAYKEDAYSYLTILLWLFVMLPLSWLIWLGYKGIRLILQVLQMNDDDIDRLLDEYAGDVFNYVNSAGDAFYRKKSEPAVSEDIKQAYTSIASRFYDKLVRAQSDGCETIQIMAHSLGTVVVYHALRGLRFDEMKRADAGAIREAISRVQHIYTIGSPLEKIRFLWPRLLTSRNLVGERSITWDNFVSRFDPVAGMLRRYNEWGGVQNHHLLGGGFISGHVVYERSPVFLDVLTHGLCGEVRPLIRSWRERLYDLMALFGETILAPVGLAIVLVAGAVAVTLTILLVPELLSIPFRFFYSPETWSPILDRSVVILVCIVFAANCLRSCIRASKAQRLFLDHV